MPSDLTLNPFRPLRRAVTLAAAAPTIALMLALALIPPMLSEAEAPASETLTFTQPETKAVCDIPEKTEIRDKR